MSLEFVDLAADGCRSGVVVGHFGLDGHLHGDSRVVESIGESDVGKQSVITKKNKMKVASGLVLSEKIT